MNGLITGGSPDLLRIEDVLSRLAINLAVSSSVHDGLRLVEAAQRELLLAPWSPQVERVVLTLSEKLVPSAGISSFPPHLEVIHPCGLELPVRYEALISEFLVESVRNWRAHGSETRAARKFAGKPENPRLEIRAAITDLGFQLEFHDDGPGVSPLQLLEKAQSEKKIDRSRYLELHAQVRNGETAAVYRELFGDGFSSRLQADLEGGRGVGLGRILQQVTAVSGKVEAGKSERLGGFVLRMELPIQIFGASFERLNGSHMGMTGRSLVRLLWNREAGPERSPDGLEFRIFHRLPSGVANWAISYFGSSGVSWISPLSGGVPAASGEIPVAGLKLNPALV